MSNRARVVKWRRSVVITDKQRIEERVDSTDPDKCWTWLLAKNNAGYGLIKAHGKYQSAHRFSYETYNGPIPDGMFVCHTCDKRDCVNPHHLWLGDNRANMLDAMVKGRHVAPIGGKCGSAKLTESAVRKLRNGEMSKDEAIAQFGISYSAAWAAANGKKWRHLNA